MINSNKLIFDDINVEVLPLGPLHTNVYLVSYNGSCVIIDPACHARRIVNALDGRAPEAILITHAHFDHVGAAAELKESYSCPVYIHELDAPRLQEGCNKPHIEPCEPSVALKDEDRLSLLGLNWRVMHTPGHSRGSACYYLDPQYNPNTTPILFSGDTLFAGAYGRTDFEGGSMPDMVSSLKKLNLLPDETQVLCGHNEATTIALARNQVFNKLF